MKKNTLQYTIAFIMLALVSLNCEKQSLKKTGLNYQEETPAWLLAKLKEKFGITQYNTHSDQSANKKLIQSLQIPAGSLSRKINSGVTNRTLEELADLLNFTNTTAIDFGATRVCYSIPFIAQPSMSLLVYGVNTTDLEEVDRLCIIDYTVDTDGNGTIITTYPDVEITDVYSSGALVSSTSVAKVTEELHRSAFNLCERGKNETFRDCFDRLYDTICDGFWGCVAWYTHPAIPVIAAAMCNCKK